MLENGKNKIAEIEKELYAKDFKSEHEDTTFAKHEVDVPSAWDPKIEEEELRKNEEWKEKQISFIKKMTKKILHVSIIFFSIALVVAAVVWYRGTNIISGGNVKIDVATPLSASGGEIFESRFAITNNNKVPLENATLYLEYEEGFYSTDEGKNLAHVVMKVGTVAPGETVVEKVNSLLYGEENSEKKIIATLEYQLSGSSAVLKKTVDGSVKVLTSPVNVKLEMLKEASSGQEFEMNVSVGSNNKDPLSNLLVEATYPSGFIFKSADPAPSFNNNVWSITELANKGEKTIKIKGVIVGQEGEEKTAKIMLGAQSPKDERVLGVVYNSVSGMFIIKKPFIGLNVTVNNESNPEYTILPGKNVRINIAWQNNNPTKVHDVVIEATLKGEVLNRNSVYAAGGGFYRSIDNTVVWNKEGVSDLAGLEPGAKGSFGFSFYPVNSGIDVDRLIKNPEVDIEVRVRAKRTSESNVPEEITSFALQKVKIQTALSLSSRGLYYSGPFKNKGALPPKADSETTYTIVWTIKNTSNSVSNATVTAVLPLYTKWLGAVSPQGEDVSFDERNSEVIWNIGRIPAGATREVAFQISFLPSLSQVGQYVDLIKSTIVSATDDFTKTTVSDKEVPVRTILNSDPKFVQEQGVVVQ